eukprot:CAMPEP_0176437080 /NCGR_PEP_ID=MMETSP0127-20121128/18393_1 /TAXON_ID=938130 /ORGANISM="Platyophrya macrostoma, Strain WH" /LENGTH=490 /DNA_ID=CAMNT_0017820607 /DNA_START=34 /DNA_END=1506 /DNA_ORIENTATION=-
MSAPDATNADQPAGAAPPTEELSERAKTVMDMFDLAGAPLKAIVARLVRHDGEAVELAEDDKLVKLGRSKDLPVTCRVDHPKLSSYHCEVHVTPATWVIEIVDTSTNGTFVNGARLEKGKRHELQPGDTISLLNPLHAEGDDAAKRSTEFLFQRLKAVAKEEQMVEELTCGICRQLFYRACTVLPCLHCFCGQHKINNLVEQLIASKPELKRPDDEIKECDSLNTIPPTGKMLKKRPRDDEDWNNSDEDEDEDEDDEDDEVVAPLQFGMQGPMAFHFAGGYFGAASMPPTSCVQCTTPAADGYVCPPHAIHIRCFSCKTAMPERPLCGIPQRCEMCSTPFCDLYFGGCKNPAGVGYLQAVKDHDMNALPARLFNGNTVEQSILSSYLAVAGTSVQTAWTECLQKFADGTWSHDIPNGPTGLSQVVCKPCCLRVFSGLLYHYRRAIPRDALPANVTNRPNCWYGKECRTQYKNVTHAQNYNHACPQEKRKE